jgi:hypothetical protein
VTTEHNSDQTSQLQTVQSCELCIAVTLHCGNLRI